MKNQTILTFAVLTALVFSASSCKKDTDNPTPIPTPAPAPTKAQILTSKNWKTIAMDINGTDIIPMMPTCEIDNYLTFKTNNDYIENEGASKCDPTDPQTETGRWQFIMNETAILIDNEDTAVLKKITSDTLRFESTFDNETSREKVIVTMVPIK